MLREHDHVRQPEGDGPRRWFTDADMDLIVWYDAEATGKVVGFQLCYDKRTSEHALTWRPGSLALHHQVDTGEDGVYSHMSPILLSNGPLPLASLTERFRAESTEIDPEIRALVLDALEGLDPKTVM